MKISILLFSILLSFNSFAYDMSETENYKDAYKELPDGSSQYIGGCSLHQDYEDNKFIVGKTIVDSFEPYDMTDAEFALRMKNVEPELIIEAAQKTGSETLKDVDDITVEKIKSTIFKNLDLYRLNIGVGGGNGMYLVFNRTVVNNKPVYVYLSNVFDGDVEYCDNTVWIK